VHYDKLYSVSWHRQLQGLKRGHSSELKELKVQQLGSNITLTAGHIGGAIITLTTTLGYFLTHA
jgi:hypothetical protein